MQFFQPGPYLLASLCSVEKTYISFRDSYAVSQTPDWKLCFFHIQVHFEIQNCVLGMAHIQKFAVFVQGRGT